jgi:dolichol kinase
VLYPPRKLGNQKIFAGYFAFIVKAFLLMLLLLSRTFVAVAGSGYFQEFIGADLSTFFFFPPSIFCIPINSSLDRHGH